MRRTSELAGASADLVELGEPEQSARSTMSVFAWDVDARLDDGRRDENVRVSGEERASAPRAPLRHLAVCDEKAQVRAELLSFSARVSMDSTRL